MNKRIYKKHFRRLIPAIIPGLMLSGAIFAQTTEFSYQEQLSSAGMPASANYDFQFTLFDALNGGRLIAVQQRLNVPVTNGIFNIGLDFGAGAFPGAMVLTAIACP